MEPSSGDSQHDKTESVGIVY